MTVGQENIINNMTQQQWESATEQERKEEIEKCYNDSYYFYCTYWRNADGSEPRKYTREEWDLMVKTNSTEFDRFKTYRHMGKNLKWPIEAFKKKGLVSDGKDTFSHVDKKTTKGKVNKIEPDLSNFILPDGDSPEMGKLKEKIENKKIKNATKVIVDGVKFDSRLELTMYNLLRGAKIEFEFQKVFILQDKFRFGKEAVRAVSLTVDFWLPGRNTLIDTKGHQTQQGALRWKMLKKLWYDSKEPIPLIEMPKNKKECQELLNRLLYDKL